MTDVTTAQIITIAGVALSSVLSALGLWVGIRNSKKTIYINSITSSRLKYIQEIRTKISEFCGLVYSYNNAAPAIPKEKMFELHREADKLKYQIRLYLNPEDTYWDDKMLQIIDEITALTDKDPDAKIDELITITQYLLKLEWEGAKLESQAGMLTAKEKESLYTKHVELHKKAISTEADGRPEI